MEDAVRTAASILGMRVHGDPPVAVGSVDELPILLETYHTGESRVRARVRVGRDREPRQIQQRLRADPELAAAGVGKRHYAVNDDYVIVLTIARASFERMSGETIATRVRALTRSLSDASPLKADRCLTCDGSEGVQTIAIQRVPTRLCDRCLSDVQAKADRARAVHAATPVRFWRANAAALVAIALGAALWAGVTIATDRIVWALGIAAGAMVGLAAQRGAGRSDVTVQAVAVFGAAAAVLVGFFLTLWLSVGRPPFDEFRGAFPELMRAAQADFILSMGGGLVGAWIAARIAQDPGPTLEVLEA